ncbi:hypothetical protein BS78_01G136800 [Paspalum vaginatum]|nr:hypothetical protein BS78_01G136800 [Paspalum vaginatum]
MFPDLSGKSGTSAACPRTSKKTSLYEHKLIGYQVSAEQIWMVAAGAELHITPFGGFVCAVLSGRIIAGTHDYH